MPGEAIFVGVDGVPRPLVWVDDFRTRTDARKRTVTWCVKVASKFTARKNKY